FDLALQKSFQLREGTKIAFGAEAYNLFNHPNFAVPSNTQSPLTLGGNGDAVFKNPTGNFANNVGRIFTTVGTERQINRAARSLSEEFGARVEKSNLPELRPGRRIKVNLGSFHQGNHHDDAAQASMKKASE